MKKFIAISILLISTFAFTNAQDLTSKKGIPILPEQGDYALGIDAVPFLEYVGNFFNGNMGNNAPSFNSAYPMTIYGKYFIDAKTAYRAKFQLGYNSYTVKEFVPEDAEAATFDPTITVEDKAQYNEMDVVLGFGLEKRRGKGRVQGIYGAEAMLMFGSDKDTYTYGNNWNPDITHHFADFGDNIIYDNTGSFVGLKTEDKMGGTFGLGVRGFVGVEYFFAPKISIGGELGWGISYMSTGEGEETYEFYDVSSTGNPFINSSTNKTGGRSAFNFGVDNISGAINLFFYF
jgi:hypothetical protein